MKKLFSLITLTLLLTVGLSACTSDKDNEKTESEDTPPAERVVSKDELKDIVFNENFTSEEYYAELANSAESIQMNIALETAKEKNDPAECDVLATEKEQTACKDDYYVNKAREDKNMETCANIQDEGKKDICESMAINAKVNESNNPEDCEALSDPAKVQRCKDNLLKDQAIEEMNEEKCDRISDNIIQKACKDIVKIRKGN